jgi:hypothetical protein
MLLEEECYESGPMVFYDSIGPVAALQEVNQVQRGITIFGWGSFSVETGSDVTEFKSLLEFFCRKNSLPPGCMECLTMDHRL